MGSERILVVDDEEPIRETVSRMADQIGYEVATASHGKEALEHLRKGPFTILITDTKMPEMDGFELMKAVRTEFPGLRTICMTPHEVSDISNVLVAFEASDYITKPFTIEEMRLRLGRVIRERNQIEGLVQKSVELEIANEELKRLDQLKSTFITGISNEVQTPMTVVKEFISLMLKGQAGSLTEEQREYLSLANKNILRLTNLIEKLLDFSRIEAGKGLRLRFKPTRLIEVIDDALMALSSQVEEKRITVENQLDPETPLVLIDRTRLMEVFVNLIGNGIKFTPPGGKVTVDSRGLSEDRNYLKIVVTDTGVGISPEDLPRIFDRFYQGQRTQEGGPRGTGLGLAITKEIIEGHQGLIHGESRDGRGASFVFTLPVFGLNTVLSLLVNPMLEEAERDKIPLSLIQVGFWDQKSQREAVFSRETWEEVVSAIQRMVRSVDTVVPFQSNKIYILTFNDKKLTKEIGKRVQGKLAYGGYVAKKTDVQLTTHSYPQEAPAKDDFVKACRLLLKED